MGSDCDGLNGKNRILTGFYLLDPVTQETHDFKGFGPVLSGNFGPRTNIERPPPPLAHYSQANPAPPLGHVLARLRPVTGPLS